MTTKDGSATSLGVQELKARELNLGVKCLAGCFRDAVVAFELNCVTLVAGSGFVATPGRRSRVPSGSQAAIVQKLLKLSVKFRPR
jgi:hypothetical protein